MEDWSAKKVKNVVNLIFTVMMLSERVFAQVKQVWKLQDRETSGDRQARHT
jgi:hypothetical protein